MSVADAQLARTVGQKSWTEADKLLGNVFWHINLGAKIEHEVNRDEVEKLIVRGAAAFEQGSKRKLSAQVVQLYKKHFLDSESKDLLLDEQQAVREGKLKQHQADNKKVRRKMRQESRFYQAVRAGPGIKILPIRISDFANNDSALNGYIKLMAVLNQPERFSRLKLGRLKNLCALLVHEDHSTVELAASEWLEESKLVRGEGSIGTSSDHPDLVHLMAEQQFGKALPVVRVISQTPRIDAEFAADDMELGAFEPAATGASMYPHVARRMSRVGLCWGVVTGEWHVWAPKIEKLAAEQKAASEAGRAGADQAAFVHIGGGRWSVPQWPWRVCVPHGRPPYPRRAVIRN